VTLAVDIARECKRRGFPRPDVQIVDVLIGPKGGLLAWARLQFRRAIEGPLLLGRDSHLGSGVFTVSEAEPTP
jgi:CRISPR-associated protein Csb2